jgi:nucleoredoxin
MDVLAGKKLVKRDGSVHDVDQVLSSANVVAFYFSAHWCPPCRNFTPLLADFYTVRLFLIFCK